MKKNFNLSSLITTVVLVGVLISFVGSDFPWREAFENINSAELESLLESFSLLMAFVVFASLFIYWIYRRARDGGSKD